MNGMLTHVLASAISDLISMHMSINTVRSVIFVGLIFVVWGAEAISWVYIFVVYLP